MSVKTLRRARPIQFSVVRLGVEGLTALGPEARARRYERGELARADLALWAARFPGEVPIVNGEFAWITTSLVDLD